MYVRFPFAVLVVGVLLLPTLYVRADAQVEAVVRAYFADAPVMVKIAECESKFRQFTDAGNPLYGGYDGKMVGVYQVYADVHRSDALALGHDLETLEGNVAYARYLYDRKGTDPWISSIGCWHSAPNDGGTISTPIPSTPSTPASTLSSNLSFGMMDDEVLLLQQILNKIGFVITSEGAGSPGQETIKFGSLTREAVRKFQCAKGIACSGDEYSTGYGYVGPRTRGELLAAASSGVASSPAAPTPATPKPDNGAAIASLKAQIAALQKQLADLEIASQ